jgi:hypothetical protein
MWPGRIPIAQSPKASGRPNDPNGPLRLRSTRQLPACSLRETPVTAYVLTEKAQSTADLLAFRKQIADVREQIERLQARLNTLSRLSAMSTIDIVMSEDKAYVPPTAPTFGTSLGRTFWDSVDSLEKLGKGLVLVLVAIAPWLPLIVVVLWLGRRGLRAALANARSATRPATIGR